MTNKSRYNTLLRGAMEGRSSFRAGNGGTYRVHTVVRSRVDSEAVMPYAVPGTYCHGTVQPCRFLALVCLRFSGSGICGRRRMEPRLLYVRPYCTNHLRLRTDSNTVEIVDRLTILCCCTHRFTRVQKTSIR